MYLAKVVVRGSYFEILEFALDNGKRTVVDGLVLPRGDIP